MLNARPGSSPPSRPARLVALGLSLGLSALACGFYQGPDRPGGEEVEGPAPPSDYNLGPTRREIDTDGDKRRDRIEFVGADGGINGFGDDTNHDGRIDRYQKIVNGKVVDESRDTNFDGVLDLRLIDTDNDGTLDKEIQLQPPLNGQPVAPQAKQAPAPVPAPPPAGSAH